MTIRNDTTEKKPRCKLVGTDGNIFALAGRASAALRKARQGEKVEEMREKFLQAQSYDEALRVLMEYVDAY